jgi:hypothetical protein
MKQKLTRILLLTLALLALGATPALGQVIYDSTVSPLPGNLPSEGAEAYAFNQFGDGVTFAGTSRKLKSVTVTLSSWACQTGHWGPGGACVTAPGATFTAPITFNIYQAGNPTPGAQIATLTQTFVVPYRPSEDNTHCTDGRWYDTASATCYNGKATNITFDFSLQNVTLPDSVVYGVVYNTSHYGPQPVGESPPCYGTAAGCPYDSLNIAFAPVVTVGTKPYLNTLYQSTVYASNYCDSGLAGTGTFRLDSPTSACWVGYVPAAQFTATNPPLTKDDCKNGGWKTRTTATGKPFKNQGACIDYVEDQKDKDKKDNDDKKDKDDRDHKDGE